MTTLETPICRIIAGSNGAGKTTFALTYLRQFADAQIFVNADLIAAGLSPLAPQLQLQAASRLMLAEIESHIQAKRNFPGSIRLLLDAHAPGVENEMLYAQLLELAR
jgi:predicted ABC-type ATPase